MQDGLYGMVSICHSVAGRPPRADTASCVATGASAEEPRRGRTCMGVLVLVLALVL